MIEQINKTSPDMITELKNNEVFVFGSNESGIHGAGAAALAQNKFGAIYRQGFGYTENISGKTFAIPTKDWQIKTLPINVINFYVSRFISFAKDNKDKVFLVTQIGCGLAGYRVKEIAPLFKTALDVENILLPKAFLDYFDLLEKAEKVSSLLGNNP